VRLMRYPNLEPGIRVTVGTDEEIDRFLEVMKKI
jgi:histidinol-phosphate/aromatic aminotransferase/cobyric acid decarboxylase-like protein